MNVGFYIPLSDINELKKKIEELEIEIKGDRETFLVKFNQDIRKQIYKRSFETDVQVFPYTGTGKMHMYKAYLEDLDAIKAEMRRSLLNKNIGRKTKEIEEDNDDHQDRTYWNTEFPEHVPEFTRNIIHTIMENICRKDKRGYRYGGESELVDLAFLIHSKSPAAYDVLLEFCLPFPTPVTLYNRFHEDIMNMKQFVKHAELIPRMLESMNYHVENTPEYEWAIAIDAVALSTWSSKDQKGPVDENGEEIKYLFIFLGMPLNFDAPNVILHVIEHANGFASGIIHEIDAAIEEIRKHLRVRVIITDGDPGYDKHQDEFINEILQGNDPEEIFKRATAILKKGDQVVWINDLIHMSKLERTRLLDATLKLLVHPSDLNTIVNVNKIRDAIELGDALNDTSPLGRIKDKYPITIFSIRAVKALLEKNYYNEALFIAPLAFWYESIRNEAFNADTRCQMMWFAYLLLVHHCIQMRDRHIKTNLGVVKIDGNIYPVYYMGTWEVVKHLTATIICFQYFFSINSTFFNFSHLTTMTEEHLNGLLRVMAHFKYDLSTTETSIAECNLTLKIHKKYDIDWKTHSRDYQAGITFEDIYTMRQDSRQYEMCKEYAYALLSKCGFRYNSNSSVDVLLSWVNEINQFHSKILMSTHISNPISGYSIFSRLSVKKDVFDNPTKKNHARKD